MNTACDIRHKHRNLLIREKALFCRSYDTNHASLLIICHNLKFTWVHFWLITVSCISPPTLWPSVYTSLLSLLQQELIAAKACIQGLWWRKIPSGRCTLVIKVCTLTWETYSQKTTLSCLPTLQDAFCKVVSDNFFVLNRVMAIWSGKRFEIYVIHGTHGHYYTLLHVKSVSSSRWLYIDTHTFKGVCYVVFTTLTNHMVIDCGLSDSLEDQFFFTVQVVIIQ